jgi:hypothetical protein
MSGFQMVQISNGRYWHKIEFDLTGQSGIRMGTVHIRNHVIEENANGLPSQDVQGHISKREHQNIRHLIM